VNRQLLTSLNKSNLLFFAAGMEFAILRWDWILKVHVHAAAADKRMQQISTAILNQLLELSEIFTMKN
jgi:hypothetical protein